MRIAIDGPAGAGKTTVAKELAKRLGFTYVDTGAMYRAFAVYFLRNSVSGEDRAAVEKACQNVKVRIVYDKNNEQRIFLNDEDVTGILRTEEVSQMASVSSAVPAVRNALLDLQRDMAKNRDVVMEGRDIGSHVLPDAEVKVFLTATSEERAKRRCAELKGKGEECSYEQVLSDIKKRDYQDSTRETAPLLMTEDAVLVDSSEMTINQVVSLISNLYLAKTGSIMFHVSYIDDGTRCNGIVTSDYKKAVKCFASYKSTLLDEYGIDQEHYIIHHDSCDLFSAENKETHEFCEVVIDTIKVV